VPGPAATPPVWRPLPTAPRTGQRREQSDALEASRDEEECSGQPAGTPARALDGLSPAWAAALEEQRGAGTDLALAPLWFPPQVPMRLQAPPVGSLVQREAGATGRSPQRSAMRSWRARPRAIHRAQARQLG